MIYFYFLREERSVIKRSFHASYHTKGTSKKTSLYDSYYVCHQEIFESS
jgi:hypothetical protein